MKIFKAIPNFITLMNLLCGCLSIFLLFNNEPVMSAWMIFIAAVFDFFDGFAARLLKAQSNIGVELDSLADVVSFGVAPAFILYHLVLHSHGRQTFPVCDGFNLYSLIVFLVPLCAAYRLAKFNVDTRQTVSFIGLPTPAVGLLIASLPLIKEQLYSSQSLTYMVFTNFYFYLGIAIVFSFLMVSNIPFFSLKFKHYKWKGNEFRWIFLLVSIILLVWLQFFAVPFILLIYMFLSIIEMLVNFS